MNADIEVQIADAEEQLRVTMLASDLDRLDALLADNLLFTNHLGQRLGKAADIAAHESGALTLSELDLSEQQITTLSNDAAIVSVRARIAGQYAGEPAGGDFRFTRVWARTGGGEWQVVAAHSTLMS